MSIVCEVPKEFCNARSSEKICQMDKLCEKVIEQCIGCNQVEKDYCKAYIRPATKWIAGDCSFASHIVREAKEVKKVNPLKLSKRK